MEGVDNNRRDVTGSNVRIPNEATSEVTALQNQFSAEFGHSGGGVFNTVLRSGTNSIHGAIYEARPEVMAVIHNHCYDVLPFSITRTPMRPAGKRFAKPFSGVNQ